MINIKYLKIDGHIWWKFDENSNKRGAAILLHIDANVAWRFAEPLP